MLDLSEAAEEMRRLSDLLDKGLEALRRLAVESSAAERDYRKQKAAVWLETPRSRGGDKITAVEREAMVNAETADARYVRDLAVDMKSAAMESVRSRRSQLSGLQSLLAAERAEAEFVRTASR